MGNLISDWPSVLCKHISYSDQSTTFIDLDILALIAPDIAIDHDPPVHPLNIWVRAENMAMARGIYPESREHSLKGKFSLPCSQLTSYRIKRVLDQRNLCWI